MIGTGSVDVGQVGALLQTACASIAGLQDGAWLQVAPGELVSLGRDLERLARLVFAVQVRLVDQIDQRRMADDHGCSSTVSLLRQALVISPAEAARRVRAGRDLCAQQQPTGVQIPPRLPVLAEAVDRGSIDPENISLIGTTMRRLPPLLDQDTRDLCEQTLVEHGITQDRAQLAVLARRIEQTVDPDGRLDPRDPAAKAELHMGSRNTATGLTPISGRLDDIAVHLLHAAIHAYAAPRPAVGGEPDGRPPATRRAHAFTEALRCLLDTGNTPTSGGGEKPHMSITINWDALHGRFGDAALADGTPISPAQARRWACDAKILPAILGTTGEVLDLGRTTRTFPSAVRRAIVLRDKGCSWPGCDRPPQWCETHHIRWWKRDLGPTSLDNGALLCGFHHTAIHTGDWTMQLGPDRHPELIPPRWVDKSRQPRRNTLHHIATTLIRC